MDKKTIYAAEKYISAVFLSIVEHPIIRFLIFITVLLNCVIIGVQTDPMIAKDNATVFLVLERIIFVILISEVSSKLIFSFRTFWMDRWNIMDLLINLVVMVAYTFVPPSQKSAIKLLRLLRSVRLFSFSEGFSKVLRNITRSFSALVNIFLLITCFMVMFGLFGVMLFGEDVPSAFGTFPTALYTLFKCLTLNGWVKHYYAFKGEDSAIIYIALTYFVSFIFLCGFLFLSLFSSIIIINQSAVVTESTKAEKEDTPKKLIHVEELMMETSTSQQHQTPCHDSCMTNLTLESFENLVMLRRAIDQNEKEQEELLQELERIVEEVRDLPINKEKEVQAQKERQLANTIIDNLLTDIIASGQAGDIVTTYIALEEANILDSRSTASVFGEGAVQRGIRRLSRSLLTESETGSQSSLQSVISIH
uniref:Cation channel sperm associated 4 n=1 Tax=Astyanax mexicanus TaxID=7994 RepID=W5LDT8_ASTMX